MDEKDYPEWFDLPCRDEGDKGGTMQRVKKPRNFRGVNYSFFCEKNYMSIGESGDYVAFHKDDFEQLKRIYPKT